MLCIQIQTAQNARLYQLTRLEAVRQNGPVSEFFLRNDGFQLRLAGEAGSCAGAEHRASCGRLLGELQQADRLWQVVINSFHSAADEISFVPKTCAAGIA